MRSLKLLVASALLFGLAGVAAARASDEIPAAPPAEAAVDPVTALAPTPDPPAASGVETPASLPADAVAESAGAVAAEPQTASLDTADPAAPEPEGDVLPAAPAPVVDAGELAGASEKTVPVLGEIGYDSDGRPGRIHIVAPGDTLWDISDTYLGTPWVWPSIWKDNRNIENPHWIHPGDHIWITDSEMRLVSPAEAEAMLAARPPGGGDVPAAQSEPMPTELAPSVPPDGAVAPAEQRFQRVSVREWVGLISPEDLEAAASIVRRVPSQIMLAQFDRVYIGLGEGDVEVGDQFEIIRKERQVEDPETGRFLGYHVSALGWLEVTEVHAEASLAAIHRSTGGIREGDRLIPRRPTTLDIPVRPSPEDVEGMIAFFPLERVVIGQLDFVYLNRGTLDGLETGSPLEVVRGGERVNEPVRGSDVAVPRRVVARLLVIDAKPETSVALVAHAETDLLVGDTFRGATR